MDGAQQRRPEMGNRLALSCNPGAIPVHTILLNNSTHLRFHAVMLAAAFCWLCCCLPTGCATRPLLFLLSRISPLPIAGRNAPHFLGSPVSCGFCPLFGQTLLVQTLSAHSPQPPARIFPPRPCPRVLHCIELYCACSCCVYRTQGRPISQSSQSQSYIPGRDIVYGIVVVHSVAQCRGPQCSPMS
jgi:hypothetical protein